MNALARLQEKIEELKNSYEAIVESNRELKEQLEQREQSQSEQQNTIDLLKYELDEKDKEIEEIILKVEALLS